MEKKKIKIGVDLDGVIIGKPFFVPKDLMEWLVRSHNNSKTKYRFPKLKAEIYLRKKSHHWLLRPPIRKNLEAIKELAKKKNIEIYIISGRYGFLKEKTQFWLKKHRAKNSFKRTFINLRNEQPHLFKERILKKLNLDYFFDDDPIIIKHLKTQVKNTKLYLVKKSDEKAFAAIKL